MKITDLISTASIDLNVKAKNKEELIEKAVKLMTKNGNIKDEQKYLELVTQREKQSSTGIGEEIAIPHGKGECITAPGVSAMVIPEGADFESLDGKPVKLLFLIAAPDTKENIHLEVLSRLSTLLMDENFRKKLINAKTKEEFIEIINEAEKEKIEDDKQKEENGNKQTYELLGITGCPTGIAHTYMAAESLEQMGNELGHPIKVETQGQSGAKNILTIAFLLDDYSIDPSNFGMNTPVASFFKTIGGMAFASADPIRVIPACVVGSAVSGALSMAFNCTLMAPHGGIFVVSLIGNP